MGDIDRQKTEDDIERGDTQSRGERFDEQASGGRSADSVSFDRERDGSDELGETSAPIRTAARARPKTKSNSGAPGRSGPRAALGRGNPSPRRSVTPRLRTIGEA
ncbi:MAG: hypothetical protein QOC65_1373 [Sphingomonadales bacterium]|nr:hypothetical protein [Sphingomonadales bacterium]